MCTHITIVCDIKLLMIMDIYPCHSLILQREENLNVYLVAFMLK